MESFNIKIEKETNKFTKSISMDQKNVQKNSL